ncbi:MAG: glycerol-3-phosphate 1-O-acyltransferase PlsY [Planctomycetes bacterium]|nr:glycerol-3-phosphate 1-O-acyltransferase PlsY [Planctomycetota bacterium]
MTATLWFLAIAIAFLFGSFPTGYMIGRARGVDIRKLGSGNIGATNVGRVFGRRAWLLCFSGDFLKGFVPVLGAGVFAGLAGKWSPPPVQAAIWCCVLAAAILGHMFTPWLGFKGGKGVATALGSLLGFFPLITFAGLAALGVFILVLKTSRYVSLASICATACLPVFVLIQTALTLWLRPAGMEIARATSAGLWLAGLTAILSAMMIWRHRANIARIRAGTEPKAGSSQPMPAAA